MLGVPCGLGRSPVIGMTLRCACPLDRVRGNLQQIIDLVGGVRPQLGGVALCLTNM